MTFPMQTYVQALRTAQFDVLLNLPVVALKAYYPTDNTSGEDVSPAGNDNLLPLLIYCFEQSDFSEDDIVHLKVMNEVINQNRYFSSEEVGFSYQSIYSAALCALCMKKEGLTFPAINMAEFATVFPEHQSILDPKKDKRGTIIEEGVIDKHLSYFNELILEEAESDKTIVPFHVEQIVGNVLFYQKKQEVCRDLKKYLNQCMDYLKRDASDSHTYRLLHALFDEIDALIFLTDDSLDKVKQVVSRLGELSESSSSIKKKKTFPDTIYSPFSALTIQTTIQQMLDSMERYQEEVKPCSRLKESLSSYLAYADSIKKIEKDRAMMSRKSLVEELYHLIEPHRFLSVELSERLQTYTLAIKYNLDKIPSRKIREKEARLLNILYEPDFLKLIAPCQLNIISDTAKKELADKPVFLHTNSKKNWKKGEMVELPKTVSFREGKEVLYVSHPVHALHSAFWKQHIEEKKDILDVPVVENESGIAESDLSMVYGIPFPRY